MSLLYPDRLETNPGQATLTPARLSFLAGVKAAFVVGQLNRLGQVLCSGCGYAWDDLVSAFNELELVHVGRRNEGYGEGLDLGADHPNNLVLRCRRCARDEKAPAR